jgi:hypothetical protein
VEGVERRPLVPALGAGDSVILVDVDDLPTGSIGDLAQLTLLVRSGLRGSTPGGKGLPAS